MKKLIEYLGGSFELFWESLKAIFRGKWDWKLVSEQLYIIGAKSLPLVLITGLSTGMVMTFQFGIGLSKFGGQPYIPKLVSLSILREMGPVFTSLMIAARVGAGMASEIGSMVVTQQIDAIRALGASPMRKIVVPRVLACFIALPMLAALANIIAIFGSMLISVTELNLDSQFFLLKIMTTLTIDDWASGMGKCIFFSFFISITACYYGLNVKEGTREVGRATTQAVVVASVLVLIGDFFLSKLFFLVF